MLRIFILTLASSVAGFAVTLVGGVRDPSGAAIPGVSIELSAEATGQSRTILADSSGQFRAAGLAPGQYLIKVAHPGFQLYTQTVAVEENQTTAVEIRLEIEKIIQDLRVSGKAAVGANSDPNYRQLRDAELGETLAIEDVVLKRDAGTITLTSGTIRFGPPILGKVTLGVFVGEGEFTLKPAHWAEASYLKRVLNKESIEERFRQLVLCFTDDTYQEIRRSARAAAAESRAPQVLQEFRRHVRQRSDEPKSLLEALLTESSMENVEAGTLADLYNPKHPGFFSAYITGRQHSHLRFHVKPREAMPALPSPEEVAVINFDPQGEQEGIWYLCHSAEEFAKRTASPHEDKRVVSAQNYRIETVIGKNDHLTAIADFRFRAVSGGDRVVHFDLLPSLRVTRVTTDTQQEAHYIQENRKADGSFSVIMPEPMIAGREYRLVIEYSGDRVIHKAGGGNFSVGARTSWYPSVNAFSDRATYDLTFKVPKSYTVVSVGKLSREWREDELRRLAMDLRCSSGGRGLQLRLVQEETDSRRAHPVFHRRLCYQRGAGLSERN